MKPSCMNNHENGIRNRAAAGSQGGEKTVLAQKTGGKVREVEQS